MIFIKLPSIHHTLNITIFKDLSHVIMSHIIIIYVYFLNLTVLNIKNVHLMR